MKRFKVLFIFVFISFIFPIILFAQQGSMAWTQATANAGWSARSSHTSVVFDNKMWVIGGMSPFLNDVWYSSDGINWTCATANAGWSGREWHTSVVFDNKMWVIGGWGPGTPNYKNDVWYSSDGINWTCATANAGWSGRGNHTSVVFDNKMWVIGGQTSSDRKNDVWYSSDGVNWTQATANAGWSARRDFRSVVFDNKMWVIGGMNASSTLMNDVWYSTDGINWTQATANAGWTARRWHTSVVFDNKMWVIGGNTSSGLSNDVGYSTDGVIWTQATTSVGWSPRSGHTSVVFDNKMWVIGGGTNDVWYSRGVVILISPNGDELWPCGSNQTIKWRILGTGFARYRLLLSRNGGSTYPDTITHVVMPTETTYNWTVPTINSTTCRVSVQILDADDFVIVQDASDTDFTITSQPTVRVMSPNGGEIWTSGSNQTIKWWAIGSGFARYRLLLSRNSGSTYPDTIAHNVIPSETTYNWTVPLINSTTCRVMVQILNAGDSVIHQDASDGNFTIRTTVTVVSPNGGEIWPGGSNQTIKWRILGTGFARYRLLLSQNGGSTYLDTIAHVVMPTETTYNWTMPTLNLNTCRIMVQVLNNVDSVIVQDASDANFTIQITVTIVSPNGNEVWAGVSNQIVRWRTIGSGFVRYRLILSTNGGATYPDTIAHNVPPNETTYNWTVPAINSITCRLRAQILDAGGSVINQDASNNNFTIDSDLPSTPNLVSPINGLMTNSANVSFVWTRATDITSSILGYGLQYASNLGFVNPRDTIASDTTITLTLADTIYYWRVRAYDLAGNQGAFSNPDSFWVDNTAPSIPNLISPINGAMINNPNVTFIWHRSSDNLSGVSSYTAEAAADPGFSVSYDTIVTDTTITVTLIDTTCYWRVKAHDRAGNQSSWSSTRSFEIDTRIPNAPVLVSPLNGIWLNNTSVIFNWSQVTVATKSPVRYILQVDTIITFVTPRIDTTSLVYDTLILPQDRYYWRVKAYDLAGNQGIFSSRDSFGVDNSAPSIPNLVSPINGAVLTDSFVRFTWNRSTDNVSGVRYYRIQIANNSNFLNPIDTLVSDSTIVRRLSDTTYYWRVDAIDIANNQSNWSSVRNFTVRTTGIEEINNLAIPTIFSLSLNSPNPFSRFTEIRYGIPFTAKVKIAVFSSTGVEIATLTNGIHNPGWYSVRWNGKDNKGKICPNGIYFYRLVTNEYQATRKMLMLR